MFIALKGWNLHTQTFNTIEDYFNPLKNTNTNLTRYAPLGSVVKGFKKVFSREFIYESLKTLILNQAEQSTEATLTSKITLLEKLYADLDITIFSLLSLEIHSHSERSFYIYLSVPQLYGGRLTSTTVDSYFRQEGDIDQKIASIISWIKSNQSNHINLDALTDEQAIINIDAPTFLSFRNISFATIWYHHFGLNNYFWVHATQEQADSSSFRPVLDMDSIYNAQDIRNRSTTLSCAKIRRWLKGFREYPELVWVQIRDPNDRSHLYRVLNYSTDVLRHLPTELREPNELNSNLYGIELEVSADAVLRQIIDAPETTYCCIKADSSIQGSRDNSYEIVSAPATTKVHKKAWAQILEKVPYTAFDVSLATNNGMHIHIGMKAFSDQTHLRNFVWFFTNPINKEFLIEIGERDEETFNQYTQQPELQGNLIRCYNTCMTAILPPFRGIVHYKGARDSGEFITLEVRLFKGIVSLASICKNIEFVDAVYNFTTKCSYITNTISNFLYFLDHTYKNRFTTLKQFIQRMDIPKLTNTIKFRQIVHGIQEPNKIIALLNNQPILYTDQHLTVLNSLLENTKFAIKDGKVYLTKSNRSLVYDLDLALGERLTRKRKDKTTCVSS